MIDPRYLTVVEWAARTTPDLVSFGSIPVLGDEADWPRWAAAVTQLPGVMAKNPPDPVGFSDWREWAFFFNQSVFN